MLWLGQVTTKDICRIIFNRSLKDSVFARLLDNVGFCRQNNAHDCQKYV